MRSLPVLSVLVSIVLLPATVAAATYVVNPEGSGDYATIQAAVDAANHGDTIELTNGVFTGVGNRDIDYLGKSITIRSQGGIAHACVVDCQSQGRGFIFQSGEGPLAILERLMVRNGRAAEYGGGVYILDGSDPTLIDCVFADNWSGYAGGGVACMSYCAPLVSGCLFIENTADNATGTGHGGGMHCGNYSYATLRDCLFAGNSATWRGGGFHCHNYSNASLENCTFYGNRCVAGGGIGLRNVASVSISNTIVAFSGEGSGVHCEPGTSAMLDCCAVYGNAGGDWVGCIAEQLGLRGNIHADPLFCDPAGGDYSLNGNSPCAPGNNPGCGLIGALGVGCGPTATRRVTWGEVKAAFR
ncbi:MAG: hypothetical protein FJY88_01550 [Candidatus Eisenbacteria bacterium]|nr:hypothetical protein [Candidatus Eisenbacteria bacterium]